MHQVKDKALSLTQVICFHNPYFYCFRQLNTIMVSVGELLLISFTFM